MDEIYGLEVGVILTTYDTWDDPPSTVGRNPTKNHLGMVHKTL